MIQDLGFMNLNPTAKWQALLMYFVLCCLFYFYKNIWWFFCFRFLCNNNYRMSPEKDTTNIFYYDPEIKDKGGNSTELGVVEVVNLKTREVINNFDLPKKVYFKNIPLVKNPDPGKSGGS